jgi:hypothetical protein
VKYFRSTTGDALSDTPCGRWKFGGSRQVIDGNLNAAEECVVAAAANHMTLMIQDGDIERTASLMRAGFPAAQSVQYVSGKGRVALARMPFAVKIDSQPNADAANTCAACRNPGNCAILGMRRHGGGMFLFPDARSLRRKCDGGGNIRVVLLSDNEMSVSTHSIPL